jgi:glycosyltransferase involved in cell wall biosynthesis
MIKADVSVIIPVFNNPAVINSINSVLHQEDYKVKEIIVVDDGSRDNTYEVLEKYKLENDIESLKLIKQKNGGPSAARNNGIRNADSKYIAFLDSDDLWNKDKLKKQIQLLESDKELKLVSTSINDKPINNLLKHQVISFDMLLYHNYLYTSTIIVEKEVFKQVGSFNENQKYSEDYDLWLRIARKHKCLLINEGCVIYGGGKSTFGVSGLSAKLWKMEQGELLNYKRLLREKNISPIKYLSVCTYSLSKYFRRAVIVFLRNVKTKIPGQA